MLHFVPLRASRRFQSLTCLLAVYLVLGPNPLNNEPAMAQEENTMPQKVIVQKGEPSSVPAVEQGDLARPTDQAGRSIPDSQRADPTWTEIVLPTQNGRLKWKEIASSLADAMHLDRQSIQARFPVGEIDLNAPISIFVLVGIELTFGDTISIRPVSNDDGTESLWIRCRSDAFGIAPQRSDYGPVSIDADQNWRQDATIHPVVILLHGLKGDARNFEPFRDFLRRQGYPTAMVRYDDRSPIAETAVKVSAAARKTFEGAVPQGVVLIGHSMGGLVAREWAERDGLWNAKVRSLVTVASPHGGSNWAAMPPLLNLIADGRMASDDIVGLLTHEPADAGTRDLIPESDFLTSLNARPRKTGVAYLTVVGTRSPLNPSQLGQLNQMLQSLDREGSLLRLLRPRIAPLIDSFEELESGQGDGVVAVSRGMMAGVTDVVTVPLSHAQMLRPPESNAVKQPVWDAISKRLAGLER